eukprot:SAG11_NODE_2251_length_3633_cov_15.438031_6_plen_125_part_00
MNSSPLLPLLTPTTDSTSSVEHYTSGRCKSTGSGYEERHRSQELGGQLRIEIYAVPESRGLEDRYSSCYVLKAQETEPAEDSLEALLAEYDTSDEETEKVALAMASTDGSPAPATGDREAHHPI